MPPHHYHHTTSHLPSFPRRIILLYTKVFQFVTRLKTPTRIRIGTGAVCCFIDLAYHIVVREFIIILKGKCEKGKTF